MKMQLFNYFAFFSLLEMSHFFVCFLFKRGFVLVYCECKYKRVMARSFLSKWWLFKVAGIVATKA
jgi:hypothetical protein